MSGDHTRSHGSRSAWSRARIGQPGALSRPINWANESFAITFSPEVQYCVGTEVGCWYDAGNERLDPGEPERTVTVDRSYVETHTPTVRNQLARAVSDWPGC